MTDRHADGLPEDVVRRAFRAANRELAWVREDAIAAAEALETAGYAVLGGEAWLIADGGRWTGLLPVIGGGPRIVVHCECERRRDEAWQGYCQRAAGEAVAVLQRLRLEDEVSPDLVPHLRYNLTYVCEEEYQDLERARRGMHKGGL